MDPTAQPAAPNRLPFPTSAKGLHEVPSLSDSKRDSDQQEHDSVRSSEEQRRGSDYGRQLTHLDEAWRELREAQAELDANRDRFVRERALAQKEWKEHWTAEWDRLSRESAQIEQRAQTVAKQAAEVELQRRQVETSWAELRREQQVWQQRKLEQEARLQERTRTLEEREADFVQAREHWENQRQKEEEAHRQCREELQSLESRVVNYRRKLATLQHDVNCLEAGLAEHAVTGRPVQICGNSDTNAVSSSTALVAAAPDVTEGMIEGITHVSGELADECLRLAEQVEMLQNLRDSWRWEWEIAVADLTLRDRELDQRRESLLPRERTLQRGEESLHRRLVDLERWQQHLQCWEARVFKRHSVFRCERRRLLATVKARVTATREQQQRLVLLQEELTAERRRELQRVLEACEELEQARREYARLCEELSRKEDELDRRERGLVERELVIAQAEQQLLTEDPDPVAAERELERRRQHWQKLALRPLSSLRRREKDLQQRNVQLERHFEQLARQQKTFEAQKAAFFKAHTELQAKETSLAAEKIRWQQDVAALRGERAALEQQVHDLQQQVEQLAVVFIGSQPPRPALAMAA